jgi:hypothetical protein
MPLFRIQIGHILQLLLKTVNRINCAGSSVAAWLSETVLRGRGPGASGFESHRRGRIFSKEGTSAGPWMCVYVFQGLTVGRWKEERNSSDTTARSGQGSNPGRMGHPERREEKRGGRRWPGKVPRSSAAPPEEKTSRPQGT